MHLILYYFPCFSRFNLYLFGCLIGFQDPDKGKRGVCGNRLTSLTTISSVSCHASARVIVDAIHARSTVSTCVISTLVDIWIRKTNCVNTHHTLRFQTSGFCTFLLCCFLKFVMMFSVLKSTAVL